MAFERLVFVDIKTTGPDVSGDEIIDFAAIRVDGGAVVDSFSQLADPFVPIPPHVTAMTGITQDDVDDCANSREAAKQFAAFVGDDVLVAHNADTVDEFLRGRAGRSFDNMILDSRELARIVLPTLEHHDLETVAGHFQIAMADVRRARDDAQAIADVWQGLIERLGKIRLSVLQAVNRIVDPIDWDLKPLFAAVEDDKLSSLSDVVDGNITQIFDDFSEILKSARKPKGDEDDDQTDGRELLDLDSLGGMFDSDGTLAEQLPNYETRPEQIEMVRAVADAYNTNRHLMIEAGTGTGKSLAYLVPSIYWAKRNGEHVIISTNTKNLQEQLFRKDIPLLKKALDEPFKAAMIKGRANYLCVRRFHYALDEADRELSEPERLALVPVITWAADTASGDISENSAFMRSKMSTLWARLYSTGTECFGRGCKHFRRCFLAKARAISMAADVVIANHSVVFSEMGIPSPVLPKYKRIVFDEAHNIENVATEHLGCRVNMWRFRSILDRLHRRTRAAGRGLLTNIFYRMKTGGKLGEREKRIGENISKATELVAPAVDTAEMFLDSLGALFGRGGKERVRYRAEDRDEQVWEVILQQKMRTVGTLADLTRRLQSIRDALEEMEVDKDFEYRADFVRELSGRLEDCEELSRDVEFLTKADDETFVYWVEAESGKQAYSIAAAPIDISQVMQANFYDQKESIILCSATLTVNNRFDFLKERIGTLSLGGDRLVEHNLGTGFDYNRQVLLCVPTFLPEPGPRGGGFEEQFTQFLIDLYLATKGRGLTLFTSYSMLNAVYPAVKQELQAMGITVLGQGHDGERDQITAVFRRVINSVMLGTHSFWEGVDLPGDTLSCLTIAKLPFAVFTDPVVEARCEAVEKSGRNAFTCYSTPSAVIRLRQGFGRLIRHKTDRGVVIVADKRIITRRYGRQFLNSLPARHTAYGNKSQMIEQIVRFLDAG